MGFFCCFPRHYFAILFSLITASTCYIFVVKRGQQLYLIEPWRPWFFFQTSEVFVVLVTSIVDYKYNCLSQKTRRNLSLGPSPAGNESKYCQHLQNKASRAATRLYIKLHFSPCLSFFPLTAAGTRKNMCCTFSLGYDLSLKQGEILGFLTMCIIISEN